MSGTYSIMRCGIRDQCAKQADEITRLRAEVERLREWLEDAIRSLRSSR